jgi:hypothetical protein
MIEKVRFWGDSAFGVGGTRKLRLRVPSPVARLRRNVVIWCELDCLTFIEKTDSLFDFHE